MGQIYKHWQDFPMNAWRWPSFSPQELASKGNPANDPTAGELMIDEASLDKLQSLRNTLGKPLIVRSAYRSEIHNRRVKGAKASQHRLAKAFDIDMTNQDPHHFMQVAKALGFTGFGTYPEQGFIHIDTGPARSWGTPWPRTRQATPVFPLEPKPRPTTTDVLKKPEVLLPAAGSAITAATPLAEGNGPVQIAIAVALVIVVVAGVFFAARHFLNRPADV